MLPKEHPVCMMPRGARPLAGFPEVLIIRLPPKAFGSSSDTPDSGYITEYLGSFPDIPFQIDGGIGYKSLCPEFYVENFFCMFA